MRRLSKSFSPRRISAATGGQADLFNLTDLTQRPRRENEAAIRRLCQNAYLGGDTSLCRVLGRYKMFVDTADVGLSSHLLLDGYWEMWTTEALAAHVKPGMVAVDVGANLGYYTVLLAELCGAAGAVHAFEPNPILCERLRKTLSVNGLTDRTVLHPYALSDLDDAQMILVVPQNEPKNGYIVAPEGAPVGERCIPVRTRRMDAVQELTQVDVVKIDADTAEEGIWRGMSGLLARNRSITIFLEFAAARYKHPGLFLDEIASSGFSFSTVGFHDGVKLTSKAAILSRSPVMDQMLVLAR